MPFFNLDARHFTAPERTTILEALNILDAALKPKMANLTPEERKKFGSVNERNKLLINKVMDFRASQPDLSCPDVDWDEFEADYESRVFMEAILSRLDGLSSGIENAKVLHDWDNYKASLVDYSFTQHKNNSGATGFSAKVEELKQFFTRTRAKKP